MKKISGFVLSAYKTGVTAIFFAIMMWLCYLAIYGTCYMTADVTEVTYYVNDSIVVSLISIAIFVLMLCLAKTRRCVNALENKLEENDKLFLWCKYILLAILLVMAVIWVVSTQFLPVDDQLCVQLAVSGLREGNYAFFAPDGYISMFTNQIGLVVLGYLCSFVFGVENYLMFQIANAVGMVIIYKIMSEIAGKFGLKRIGQLIVLLMGLLFCPLILYCSFVYGNVLGLTFSVVAIKYEIAFFERKRKRDAVISALAIMLAIMIKNNYMIAMIAMLIYAIVEIIRKPNWRYFLFPVLIIVCYVFQAEVPTAFLESKTGYDLSQGATAWSFVAMGLRGQGWFDAYNVDSYVQSGYNSAVQAEMAKESIKGSLANFFAHKRDAVCFFTKKVASTWNNPTFQGFWVLQVLGTKYPLSELANEIISIGGMDRAAAYLNVFQLLVVFGAWVNCIFSSKRKEYDKSMIFVLFFIGGFLFHIVWETKCQYAVTYYVLLFPLAVQGYERLTDVMVNNNLVRKTVVTEEIQDKEQRITGRDVIPFAVLFAIIAIVFYVLYGNGYGAYLGKDTAIYESYAHANASKRTLEEGTYRFHTKDGADFVAYSPDGAAIMVVPASDSISAETVLWVENAYSTSNGAFNFEVAGYDQPWVIKFVDEDSVCILYERIRSKALTYDSANGSVSLEKYTGADNQLWSIERIDW